MNFIDYLFRNPCGRDKVAVIFRSEQVTYGQLRAAVARVSSWLASRYGEGQRIVLISENSPFFITAYLGILRSGNVCVPLNPGINPSRLAHIIRQCRAETGFISSRANAELKEQFENTYDEARIASLPPVASETGGIDDFDSSRLAEIIYTSGSTALPKGVMISHRNLIANTESIITYLQLREDDRVAAVLPFYYCYGLSLLHTHLKIGGSLVLNNTFMMLNTLIDDIQQHECTGFAGVPSHFQIMLRKSRRFREADFPSLRYVTQAGGKLPNSIIKEFCDLFPGIKFFVMYGQTEATARLSYLPPEMLHQKMGSIGKGIPGVKLEVIDKHGRPVGAGQTGEIVAGGNNIMLGYFQDPDLTAATVRDGKLYTGDIGRIDEDGYIYIVAREKEFIKVGGERVSPKEIEEVIVSMAEVVDCSVVGIEDDLTGEAILAYVVPGDGKTLSEREIVHYCSQRLSSGKIPKYIEMIEHIPTSETGKKIRFGHRN